MEAEVFPKILTCLKFPDELVRKHAATVVREVWVLSHFFSLRLHNTAEQSEKVHCGTMYVEGVCVVKSVVIMDSVCIFRGHSHAATMHPQTACSGAGKFAVCGDQQNLVHAANQSMSSKSHVHAYPNTQPSAGHQAMAASLAVGMFVAT